MYSDVSCENTVFRCILMYFETYSCILWFAIEIHCALFMYPGVDDVVENDGAGTSKEDAKKSAKKRGKEKEVAVKKEKADEPEPPAKRQRKPARR